MRAVALLRDLVLSGRVHPSRVTTHHRGLEDAPVLVDAFDRRQDSVIKAVLHRQQH